VVFASEPMPPALLERWWDALPTVETHEFYGMTEVLPITYASHRMLRAQPTSVGLPFPTSSVSVVDEAGAELPPAASGEVICGSAARMHGYLGDEQATAGSTTPAGAMRTGDLGWFDEAGLLFLSGRLKDVIISGGLNIVPAEIEAVACRHPQVAVAAVVGIPDARWGETPVVVAVPTPGATITAGDVLEHCRHGLASFKRPSGAALVEVLPVTGIGKSAKTVIRQQVLDGTIALVRSDRARPLSA
jgi:acyl-CoA synthetase (AMP-forming)/AMP-acid ligase II